MVAQRLSLSDILGGGEQAGARALGGGAAVVPAPGLRMPKTLALTAGGALLLLRGVLR